MSPGQGRVDRRSTSRDGVIPGFPSHDGSPVGGGQRGGRNGADDSYNDMLESELSGEVENGRLVRLMIKLGFINERAE